LIESVRDFPLVPIIARPTTLPFRGKRELKRSYWAEPVICKKAALAYPDQSNCADDNDEDHSQRYSLLSNVLTIIVRPELGSK